MATPQSVLEAYGSRELNEYTHWVYVLSCNVPYREFSDLERKAQKRIGGCPWWVREAFESQHVYYVGQTENLEMRLGQHLRKQNGSNFTTLFDPNYVSELWPKFSRDQAKRWEVKRAKQIRQQDRKFAYYSQR